MNIFNFEHLARKWVISHNPYTDIFQMYDNDFSMNKKQHLLVNKPGGVRVVFDRETKRPVFIEINRIYGNIGVEIDNLGKTDIIKLIKPFVGNYGN